MGNALDSLQRRFGAFPQTFSRGVRPFVRTRQASMGVLACYSLYRCQKDPDFFRTALAGVTLGLAQLAKTTWVVLFVVLPVAWGMSYVRQRRTNGDEVSTREKGHIRHGILRQIVQLAIMNAIALYVWNTGYGFQGTGKRLGSFQFSAKHWLAVKRDGLLARLEVVLQERCCNQCRRQCRGPISKASTCKKVNFEVGCDCYMAGKWKKGGGWWYFYLFAMLVKLPAGTLTLLAISLLQPCAGLFRNRLAQIRGNGGNSCVSPPVALWLPPVVVFILVSSQTGMTSYVRYTLPCFLFLAIWLSRLFRKQESNTGRPKASRWVIWLALSASIVGCLSSYPHMISFQNLAWRFKSDPPPLIDSSLDWGQNLLCVRDWLKDHPEATRHPVNVSVSSSIPLELLDINYRDTLTAKELEEPDRKHGWLVLSTTRLFARESHFEEYKNKTPVVDLGGVRIYAPVNEPP